VSIVSVVFHMEGNLSLSKWNMQTLFL